MMLAGGHTHRARGGMRMHRTSIGDWGDCGADDDDDFDEPGSWRDNMALGDWDA